MSEEKIKEYIFTLEKEIILLKKRLESIEKRNYKLDLKRKFFT